METTNKHLVERLESIDATLKVISNTLVRQEEQLKYHILRTDLLEDRVKPLETFTYKLMGGLTVVSALLSLLKLLGKI